ncbi:hypothetical protein DFJ73DRAFT_43129 [Zopfochytrium polystomum]|nr:hypothetical protein DFJ73DRAFT_43129 [Zopfochytrium polystomum]
MTEECVYDDTPIAEFLKDLPEFEGEGNFVHQEDVYANPFIPNYAPSNDAHGKRDYKDSTDNDRDDGRRGLQSANISPFAVFVEAVGIPTYNTYREHHQYFLDCRDAVENALVSELERASAPPAAMNGHNLFDHTAAKEKSSSTPPRKQPVKLSWRVWAALGAATAAVAAAATTVIGHDQWQDHGPWLVLPAGLVWIAWNFYSKDLSLTAEKRLLTEIPAFTESAAAFDAAVFRGIKSIQEFELVSKGYRLSTKTVPIPERSVQQLRCRVTRQTLRQVFLGIFAAISEWRAKLRRLSRSASPKSRTSKNISLESESSVACPQQILELLNELSLEAFRSAVVELRIQRIALLEDILLMFADGPSKGSGRFVEKRSPPALSSGKQKILFPIFSSLSEMLQGSVALIEADLKLDLTLSPGPSKANDTVQFETALVDLDRYLTSARLKLVAISQDFCEFNEGRMDKLEPKVNAHLDGILLDIKDGEEKVTDVRRLLHHVLNPAAAAAEAASRSNLDKLAQLEPSRPEESEVDQPPYVQVSAEEDAVLEKIGPAVVFEFDFNDSEEGRVRPKSKLSRQERILEQQRDREAKAKEASTEKLSKQMVSELKNVLQIRGE